MSLLKYRVRMERLALLSSRKPWAAESAACAHTELVASRTAVGMARLNIGCSWVFLIVIRSFTARQGPIAAHATALDTRATTGAPDA
ncbi:hypothetical protein D3C84_872350 [compost metagenome]